MRLRHYYSAFFIAFFASVSYAQDIQITSTTSRPVSLYGSNSVTLQYGNLFRYDLNSSTTSTPIGAAPLPGALGPSAADIAKPTSMITNPATTVQSSAQPPLVHAMEAARPGAAHTSQPAQTPPPYTPPDYPEACDQSSNWPTDTAQQKARITKCWLGIRELIEGDPDPSTNKGLRGDVANLRHDINTDIRAATNEQRCYLSLLKSFSQPILSTTDATALVAFATANATPVDSPGTPLSCHSKAGDDWPLDEADTLAGKLNAQQMALGDLANAPGYSEAWATTGGANLAANSALVTLLNNLYTEVVSYSTGSAVLGSNSFIGQTHSDYLTAMDSNKQWRHRLEKINSLADLIIVVNVNPCREWYGKGRTDNIQLTSVDISSSAGTSQSLPLATNTCNPLSIISTGIGVSLLSNPTYGFVPDGKGNQVIGETAVNHVQPLYGIFYNVLMAPLGHTSSVELFVSPGVGLTSSSSTTTTDFLGGISLGFARRLLFVTASADIGQRTQLTAPYTVGSMQTFTPTGGTAVTLSSVPTQSVWKTGFMISVSFGIAPSN